VGEDDRVVVDVDDPRVGGGLLGDLVRVVRRGDAGADVEELADPGLLGQVADGAGEEPPVRLDPPAQAGGDGQDAFGGFAVGREIVLAAQPVVVDAGRVGDRGVDREVDGRVLRGAAGSGALRSSHEAASIRAAAAETAGPPISRSA
jgi:hypothetical protein